MKQAYAIIILSVLGLPLLSANGTLQDSARVIVGSQVKRIVDVLANDDASRGYALHAVYPTMGANFSAAIEFGKLTYHANSQLTTNNDTVYYVAKDALGVLDTNYVVVRKSDLLPDLFPGDANKDNICNHIDILQMGVAYGKSNIEREGLYKSDNWASKRAYDWSFQSAMSNFKHADADGNGIVDSSSDVPVIMKNYNLSSATPNIVYSPIGGKAFQISALDTFKLTQSSATFPIQIQLGTNMDMQDAYGIAFTIKYDTNVFKANQILFNPSEWFTDQHNTLNFARVNPITGELDLAMVRRDGGNGKGSGSLGIIEVVVVDILGGLAGGLNTNFEIKKAVLIDSFYNLKPVTLASPKTVHLVKKSASSIQSGTSPKSLLIYQEAERLILSSIEQKKGTVKIYNILGSNIYTGADWNQRTMEISVRDWNPGLYFIEFKNEYYKIQIH